MLRSSTAEDSGLAVKVRLPLPGLDDDAVREALYSCRSAAALSRANTRNNSMTMGDGDDSDGADEHAAA